MAEANSEKAAEGEPEVESPPAAPVTEKGADDAPRARLNQLAGMLVRGMNRQLLAEYLRLRRAVR